MILETKNKKVVLIYRTRKIVQAIKELDGKNFEELYFKALSANNTEALAKIILVFAEDKDSGLQAFKNGLNEVYDFIDDYMTENKKSYEDIYKEVAEDINKEGFFNHKMTSKQLQERIASQINLDVNEIIQKSAEKAISNIVEPELMGQISKG